MLEEQGEKSISETIIKEPPAMVRLVEAIADQVVQGMEEERSPEFSAAHETDGMSDEDLFAKTTRRVLDRNKDPRLQTVSPEALTQAIRDTLDRRKGARPWQNQP